MKLGLKSWSQYQKNLEPIEWKKLLAKLTDIQTFHKLVQIAECIVCENDDKEIIGMAFLVPKGHPTEIYEKSWAYIRFVSVHPNYAGKGIGRQLTVKCIEIALKNKETIIALHTSEMMKKALKLYKSVGFVLLKEIEPRLGKRYWLYTLNLKMYNENIL